MSDSPLLEVTDLSVDFPTSVGWVNAVNGVSFHVNSGETVGLVGESGSGKTVTQLAVMGLIPRSGGRVRAASIALAGRELLLLSERERRALRGSDVAMIFQEPMTSLNPAYTVGDQIAETVRQHRGVGRKAARARAIEVLDLVGIANAAKRVDEYPFQFSGGMRQRVMIAMALSCDPKLLIADEPTTALDVTIQAQVLDLLRTMRDELGMAILLVTHDLGVVAETCERIVVMYAGEVVETGSVVDIFGHGRHPYTGALLAAMPQLGARGARLASIAGRTPEPWAMPTGCRFHPRCTHATATCSAEGTSPPLVALAPGASSRCLRVRELASVLPLATDRGTAGATPGAGRVEAVLRAPSDADTAASADTRPVLEMDDVSVEFRVGGGFFSRGRPVRAVQSVSIALSAGETLGLVGESGSGKSSAARAALRLVPLSGGRVRLLGNDISTMGKRQLAPHRRRMQMVFQDPYSSLNPSMRVAECVGEPLTIHEGVGAAERDQRVSELLGRVGLSPRFLDRYPYEFSGGQRQRLAIARAIAARPNVIACDEAVSALDVSTRNQVINLLEDLQAESGVAYLFISHDLAVVRHIAQRVAVMYLGRIVEVGPVERVYESPGHPYTEALLSAIPLPDPRRSAGRQRIILAGDIPDPSSPPSGCVFHPRCPYAMDVCRFEPPPMTPMELGGGAACHLHSTGPELRGSSVLHVRTSLSGAER